MKRSPAVACLLAVVACSDSTGPTEAGLVGCHLLAASELTNGAPARSALVRVTAADIQVISDVSQATTAGYDRGVWSLEDGGELQLSFGGGFVGVTYTFTVYHRGAWLGDVEFWVDTPVLNGTGTASLTRVRCP